MVKTFDCIKCGGHHVRPINRNCKMEKDKDTPVDANSQILQELRNLSGRMTQMEDKMEALGSTVSSPARSKTSSMPPQRSPAWVILWDDFKCWASLVQPCLVIHLALTIFENFLTLFPTFLTC